MRRRITNGEECDAYTRWRHLLIWQRGELAAIKRRTHKRERQEGKRAARDES